MKLNLVGINPRETLMRTLERIPKEDPVTEDGQEDFITEDPKEDPITEDPKEDSIF